MSVANGRGGRAGVVPVAEAGEVIASGADVIGELRNTCVAGAGPMPL